MATFPDYKPRVGASKSSAPTVRSTKFGDGYEQRVRFGLNQDPKEWTLEWNVTETVADEIETFLEARAGASPLTGHHLIPAPATSGSAANGRRPLTIRCVLLFGLRSNKCSSLRYGRTCIRPTVRLRLAPSLSYSS
jgi:hypothetical protein